MILSASCFFFRSHLAEFEAEFDSNLLLLHISHLTGRHYRKTALTRRHKNV